MCANFLGHPVYQQTSKTSNTQENSHRTSGSSTNSMHALLLTIFALYKQYVNILFPLRLSDPTAYVRNSQCKQVIRKGVLPLHRRRRAISWRYRTDSLQFSSVQFRPVSHHLAHSDPRCSFFGSPMATNVVLVVVVLLLFLGIVVSTKAFSFHNRSSSDFAHRLVTTLSTIALCRIFKLSPNYLTFNHDYSRTI